jgi:hypothetical protein
LQLRCDSPSLTLSSELAARDPLAHAAQLVSSWEKMGIIPKEKVISTCCSTRDVNRQDLEIISIEVASDTGSGSGSASDLDSDDA